VPAEDRRRADHLGARAARRDERVGRAVGLQLEAHRHRAARLAAQDGRGLVGHRDHVGRVDDRDAVAVGRLRGALAGEDVGQGALDQLALADQLDRVFAGQLGEREQRARDGARGAKSPPIASTATRATSGRHSGFLRLDTELAAVVAALAAHAVRALHAAALRAGLDGDGGGGLVGVAGALLPLAGAALRDGHGRVGR
jgi:hypothetical protein